MTPNQILRDKDALAKRIIHLPKWARMLIFYQSRCIIEFRAALKASTPKHPFYKTKKNP